MSLLQRLATPIQVVMTLALYVELALVAGMAAAPGAYGAFVAHAWIAARVASPFVSVLAGCVLGALAYFAYTITIIFVVPILRIAAPGTPVGRYPYYSWKAFQ